MIFMCKKYSVRRKLPRCYLKNSKMKMMSQLARWNWIPPFGVRYLTTEKQLRPLTVQVDDGVFVKKRLLAMCSGRKLEEVPPWKCSIPFFFMQQSSQPICSPSQRRFQGQLFGTHTKFPAHSESLSQSPSPSRHGVHFVQQPLFSPLQRNEAERSNDVLALMRQKLSIQ